MGVEPTTDTDAGPVTGFEDRGIHRDTSIPVTSMLTGNEKGVKPSTCPTEPPARFGPGSPVWVYLM